MINIQKYSQITIIAKDVCTYKRKLNNDEIKDTNLLLKNILGGDWSEKIRYKGHIGSEFVIILDNSSNDTECPSIIIKIQNK